MFVHIAAVVYIILMVLYAYVLIEAHSSWRTWLPFWLLFVIGFVLFWGIKLLTF